MSDKEYIATVITPFHNTKLEYFKYAVDSVVNQTEGIENNEWIIVVHNSEDEYLQGVKEMTKGYDSIKVYELHNDIHTASSPRNYALDRATGKYIFFLDSDDRLTTECVHDVTRKMEETGASMAKYRSLEETEDEDVARIIDHRVRYDQTQSMILLKKGEPGIKNIITLDNMVPWCQSVRRDFLEKHGIRFDLTMHMFEDFMFTLTCMGHLDTIVVLPQTIGYVYFVNHDSTLQQMGTPTPDAVFGFIRNHTRILKVGIDAGLDIRYVFWFPLVVLCGMIKGTPQLTAEQRDKIKSEYEDIFDHVEPLDADGKIYTEESAAEIMSSVKDVILGEERDGSSEKAERDVLFDILRENRNTDIGKRFEFNLIHNFDAYATRVPLSDYDFYDPMIKLTTRIGESGIFCHDKIKGNIVGRGSIGVPKKIPFTSKHLQQYGDIMISTFKGCEGSTFMMISGLPRVHKLEDGTYVESLYGGMLRHVEDSLGYNSHRAKFRYGMLTSPRELVFPDEPVNPVHLWLLFALADESVSQIVAPSAWAVLEVFEYLERNHERVIADLRAGSISMTYPISDDMKQSLETALSPDPKRIDEVEKIINDGFDTPIAKKLWPDLERIVTLSNGSYAIYDRGTYRYIDSSIKRLNGPLMSPESVIASPMGDGTDHYILLSNQDYHEFVPIDGSGEKDRPLRGDELVDGCDYEIIVTNHAGLYRYRTNLIIHMEYMADGVPVFSYLRKKDEQCTCDGVTLTINHLDDMICGIADEGVVQVRDYCMGADEDESHFRILIETDITDEGGQGDTKFIAEKMDKALCKISDEYAAARQDGRLSMLEVMILEPETQLLFRDKTMYAMKYMPDQLAPVRILDNPSKEKFFMQFAI